MTETQAPAHFRSNARTYDAKGEHTGPGDWLIVIHAANRIAKGEGTEPIFDVPTSTGEWWAGGHVEEYLDARVLHREDDSVSIVSKTDRGADLIKRAAASHGWIA